MKINKQFFIHQSFIKDDNINPEWRKDVGDDIIVKMNYKQFTVYFPVPKELYENSSIKAIYRKIRPDFIQAYKRAKEENL